MKKLIYTKMFVILFGLIAMTAYGVDFTAEVYLADFEGGGTDGIGLYVSPAGSVSSNYSWADNGPSADGNECLYLYSIAPGATFYSVYHTETLVDQVPYKGFDISVDVKNSWSNAYTFWNFTVTFTDDTTESLNRPVEYVNPLGSWVTLTDSRTLTEQTKDVKKVMLHMYVYPYGTVGRNTCVDNIIIEGTRAPIDCNEVRSLGYYIYGDLNEDCRADMKDMKIVATDWLDCIDPCTPGCRKPWEYE